MSKPRMGRPPLPEENVRSVVFTVRMTQEERDEIADAARLAGKPATAWARETLVTGAKIVRGLHRER